MPGSPPISNADPGTMPPPVTRSSSARPVGMRAILSAACVSVSSPTTRPFDDRARPEPGGSSKLASSISVFHSPQAPHLPAQRGDTAPQFWHTNWLLAGLAMPSGSRLLVDAIDALAEPGE